ncbi:N-acetylglucosamine kinase [Marinimicrobium sp. ABcell2]|uniref:N-acetylglucosamine kinase n=1 Tax=Marinimicrobium sp. ABcell2 TaxID=3069751 RepID=UPI0027B67580|nr:BadF/BadG/BcrA/BcrD ATPase family protein [Marinimicrobium sp. ABcell2]MDQ2075924.1 BadF/BadG/BcrA/BcrD ATPase family protein [Marinimicrobium sp. ABcell2]
MLKAPANQPLYLGVDGGGTKCRACVADGQGNLLGVGMAGSANASQGLELAQNSIVLSAQRALDDAGLPPETLGQLVAGLGLAGVNLPSVYRAMKEWAHPFASVFLTTDLHIACFGAHGQENGAVIIAGTGSCGYVRVDGDETMLGGHGFPLGDKGSGAWMGLEAVKAILLACDDLGPKTSLTAQVEELLQVRGLALAERLAKAGPSEFARLAPCVMAAADAGDEIARNIVQEGADYISALAGQLLKCNPPRLALLGGLAQPLTPWLDPAVARQLVTPLGPPESGAVRFAQQEHVAGES